MGDRITEKVKIQGEHRLMFTHRRDGTILEFNSVSMGTYVAPSDFLGKHLKDILPNGDKIWNQVMEAVNKLESKSKGLTESFIYELDKQRFKATISIGDNLIYSIITPL